jgi:DNA-binding transcriptional regulator YiaG
MARSPRPYEIKQLRLRHGITQKQLADSLYGVKWRRIVDWECDRRTCPPITWWAMRLTWDKVDLWEEERK